MPTSEQLSSWKEIARHLGVTVRTAQKWERERGLPVHRLPGQRSIVSASVLEVDSWRGTGVPERESGQPHSASRGLVIAVAVVLLLSVGVVLFALEWRHGNPVTVLLENEVVRAFDADGRLLWHRRFAGLSVPEAWEHRATWWAGDLEGRGRNVVLFAYRHDDMSVPQVLYCLNPDGTERWHYVPGHSVRTATESFDGRYVLDNFLVVPYHGQQAIVVSSHHGVYYPTQVALLSAEGRVISEYWHPGHLRQMAFLDLDHLGAPLLYLGGINNAEHRATLLAMTPDQLRGTAREQNPAYQFQDLPIAPATMRLLFPHACLTETLPYNQVSHIEQMGKTLIVSVVENYEDRHTTMHYHINVSGAIERVEPVDSFLAVHAAWHQSGRVNHAWSPAELPALQAVQRIE